MKWFKRRPTSEEVIDEVVSLFTEEELEILNKEKFRKFFVNCCTGSTPKYSISYSREIAKDLIEMFREDGDTKRKGFAKMDMVFELRSALFNG